MSCKITGIDEAEKIFNKMEITDSDLKTAANKIGNIIANEMKNNIAVDTGKSKISIKKKVTVTNGQVYVNVRPTEWKYKFQEYGTSRSKKNVGRLARAISSTESKCMEVAKGVIRKAW